MRLLRRLYARLRRREPKWVVIPTDPLQDGFRGHLGPAGAYTENRADYNRQWERWRQDEN